MRWVLALALLAAAAPLWAEDPPPAPGQKPDPNAAPSADRLRDFEALRQRSLAQAGVTDGSAPPLSGQGQRKPGLDEGPAPPDPSAAPSPERLAKFQAMQSRVLQASGIDPNAGGLGAPSQQAAEAVKQQFAQQEAARAAAYDTVFDQHGAYQKMVEFSKTCSADASCDRIESGALFLGADHFVALKQDVGSGLVAPGSGDYERRKGDIKTQVGEAVVQLQPKQGARPEYVESFQAASDPVVQQIFTPQEQLKFAVDTAGKTDTAPGYAHLGKVLASQGQLDDARQAFNLALDRDPKYAPALSGRALADYGLRDYPAAAGDAAKALELSPSDEEARQTLSLSEGRMQGGSFAGLNREVKAPSAASPLDGALADAALAEASGVGAAAQSLELSQDGGAPAPGGVGPAAAALSASSSGSQAGASPAAARAAPLVAAARRALAGGDAHAALLAAEKAAAADPKSPAAQALLSVANNQLQDYAAALSAAEAGLAVAPKDPVLLLSQATALNHLKRHAEALAVADALIAAAPKNAVARFNRAEALAGLGRRQEALASLKEAAGLDPRFAPVYTAALQLAANADMGFLFGEDQLKSGGFDWPRAATPAAGALMALLLMAGLLRLRRRAPKPSPPPLRGPAPAGEARSLSGGRYELKQRLGDAGVAVVYAGYDTALRRPVVVKRLRDELRPEADERRRFLREGKALAALRHPNLVRLLAVEEQGSDVFLVFDRPEGRTLADILSLETRLPFARARALFRGVAAALDYSHAAGFEHRDLRPSCIVVGEGDQARVLDFGLARLADETARLNDLSVRLRASAYMAPEQREHAARKESDVYAMAACAYEALTGRPPFRGVGGGLPLAGALEPPTMLVPGLPAGVDDIFARALSIEPHRRYSSASALQRALETLDAPLAA